MSPQYVVRMENHPEYKAETYEAGNPAQAAKMAAEDHEDFYIMDVKEKKS